MSEVGGIWMNEWMHEWMNEWMHEWMNERMNERTNERMNEWMNDEWMNLISTGYILLAIGQSTWESCVGHYCVYMQRSKSIHIRHCERMWTKTMKFTNVRENIS